MSEDLTALQKSLFEESWKGFLKDLKSACPSISSQTRVRWIWHRAWDERLLLSTDDRWSERISKKSFFS